MSNVMSMIKHVIDIMMINFVKFSPNSTKHTTNIMIKIFDARHIINSLFCISDYFDLLFKSNFIIFSAA